MTPTGRGYVPYMARYTKPELREQVKEEIKVSEAGGRKGQWSARKSQLLAQEYKKRGGGYEGPRDERQKSLRRWGDEQWQTKDGATRARHQDETSRYLPKRAWEQLSEQEQRATDTKKRRESKSGKQYVANTRPAKRARRNATTAGRLSELPVAEAVKLLRTLDTGDLGTALKREREGKARKTLIQRMQSELNRR